MTSVCFSAEKILMGVMGMFIPAINYAQVLKSPA
jgi:hypothetical protein